MALFSTKLIKTASIRLVSKSNRPYTIRYPRFVRAHVVGGLAFAFARGGSTLLSNLLTVYCQRKKIAECALFEQAFEQGVHTNEIQGDAAKLLKRPGILFTGFRHFPKFKFSMADRPAVLLVRDPRDMIVSTYFSVIKSHKIPDGNQGLVLDRKKSSAMDIDQFAIDRTSHYSMQFSRYRRHLSGVNLAVFRYEDVIYRKPDWLGEMIQHLHLPLDHKLIQEVAEQFDIIPDEQDESKHIRQVHPGDHRSQLQPATIEQLNRRLAEFLSVCEYPANPADNAGCQDDRQKLRFGGWKVIRRAA